MRTLLRIDAILATVIMIVFLATAAFTLQRQNAQADETHPVFAETELEEAHAVPKVALANSRASVPPITPSNETQIVLKTKIIEIDHKKLALSGLRLKSFIPQAEEAQSKTSSHPGEIRIATFTANEATLFTNLIQATNASKILAEPTVVTVEGRPASFHNGGEFPVVVPQGNGTTNVEHRKFGTSVDFTATRRPNNYVRVEVKIQQSELDHSRSVSVEGTTVPGIRTRWIDTGFEVEAGKTVVLYGDQDDMLVFMVTPEIVEPIASTPLPRQSAQPIPFETSVAGQSQTLPAVAAQQAAPPQPAGTAGRPVAKSPQQPNQVASSDTENQRPKQLSQHFGPDHPQVVEQRTRVEAIERQQARQAEIRQEQEREKWHRSVDEFEQVSHELFPDADIKLREIGTGVIISGTVSSSEQARVLSAIAEGLFPNVINNLRTIQIKSDAQVDSGEQLQEVLAELFPNSQLRVRPLNSSVVLSGELDEKLAQQAVRIAEDFYPQVLDHTKPPRTSARGIAVQPAPATPAPEAPAPVWREPVQPAAESSSIGGELRALREDVRVLRRDVSRLIEILEDRDEPATNAIPRVEEQSNANPSSADTAVWQLLGVRVQQVEVDSEKHRAGLKILKVRDAGPAQAEGIRVGDILVRVNQSETSEAADLHYAVAQIDIGRPPSLDVQVLRSGEVLHASVKPLLMLPKEPRQQVRPMKLGEAIAVSLQNSKPIRDLGIVVQHTSDSSECVLVVQSNESPSTLELQDVVSGQVAETVHDYWMLWNTYRDASATRLVRDQASRILRDVRTDENPSADEVQNATAYYFTSRFDHLQKLKRLDEIERNLRKTLGLAGQDGAVLSPIDEPNRKQTPFSFQHVLTNALLSNPTLKRTRSDLSLVELDFNSRLPTLVPTFHSQGATSGIEMVEPLGRRARSTSTRSAELQLLQVRWQLEEKEMQLLREVNDVVMIANEAIQSARPSFELWQAGQRRVASVDKEFARGVKSLADRLAAHREQTKLTLNFNATAANCELSAMKVRLVDGTLLKQYKVRISDRSLAKADEERQGFMHQTTPSNGLPNPTVALKAGDQLAIESLVDGTLNRHITILPDGTVTLPLLGQVKAAGHTLAELHEDLDMRYSKHYKEPSLLVSFFGTSISSDGDASDLLVRQASQQLDPKSELTPGTALMIESLVDSKLNRRVIILADGTISLPLLGQVNTNGMTIGKLRAELGKAYKKIYKEVLLTLSFAGTSIPSKH